ncbi:LppC putative lipoprotein domain containing protein [Profundibacterium mesophilum KAUST100406-0324]|uniref:LppC putative lipoprotein domain containing protein n=1 Tax=Profundibacterium mesophilum KAUST100406-0324 TaxID=1037889 RepID=A0A921NP97_9RHOB|nr:LppC putative lipoprotein domain containing protein [Profundibacterium mesophilum KAUST100406-0324]
MLPLSGGQAQLGRNLSRAARLAAPDPQNDPEFTFADSGTAIDSAVLAARAAVAGGARMLLGPLFGAQAAAVAQAVGRDVPVVSFSNDASLAGGGLFIYGVTPAQSASAVLGYAAARGKRRITVVAPPGALGTQAARAAAEVARRTGITLGSPVIAAGGIAGPALLAQVRAASGGTLPDAVYLPAAGPELPALASALGGSGVQLLGSAQWASIDAQSNAALRGAWYAAPDPLRFDPFAEAYREAFDESPGILAGLAFDAVEMARYLGRVGAQDAAGLTRPEGFNGILGPYSFASDGTCQRALAVLQVEQGALTLIGGAAG